MDANPFADLIPAQAQPSNQNPFADLIPQNNNSSFFSSLNGLDNNQNLYQVMSNSKNDTEDGDKFLTGLGSGFMKVGEGIKGAYLQGKEALGLAPQGTYQNYQKATDAEHAFYDQTPYGQSTAGKIGSITAQTLPYMLPVGDLFGAAKAVEAAPSLASLVAKGAATNAGVGALQYVPENGSRSADTIFGGVLGGGLSAVGGLASKAANAITGNFANPAAKAIIDLGKKWGVRVIASDADPTAVNNAISHGLEELPVGMRTQRQAQMQEAQAAAQNATDQAKNQMLNTNFGGAIGMAKLQQVASGTGIRAKAAGEILDQINNAGDDWQKIMQSSGNLKLFRSKLIADQKYNKVSQLADSFGDVSPNNAVSAINKSISDVQNSVLPDNQLINQLQTIKGNLTSRGLNYSQMRQARSDIGDLINGYYSGSNALIPAKGVGALQGVKNAIGSDMDTFAQTNGQQLKTAWKNADQFYQDAVAPYKDRQLAQALSNADPDTIYSKFITRGNIEGGQGTGRAQRFYNALDNKGQAAVRYGMVQNAFQNAVDQNAKTFSPATFASQLENIASSKGVFFRGDGANEINGLTNLMRSVQRAPAAISKPDTGVKAIPWVVGAAVAGHAVPLPTALTVGGTGYGLKLLMTNPIGRNYLLAASKLKVGSPAMQQVLDNAANFIHKSLTIGALNSGNDALQGGQ